MDVEQARASHDELAGAWHPRNDYRTDEARRYTAWMDEHVAPYVTPGCRLLDVGCSTGKMTLHAETLGADAVGIDCSPVSIGMARDVAGETDSAARFVVGDFSHLPLADGSFDVAIFPLNVILCGYDEMSGVAREISRTLRTGGTFIVTLQDETARILERGDSPFGPVTGRHDSTLTAPGGASVAYPTYFWTPAFAAHVIGQRLSLEHSAPMGKDRYLLVFRNEPSPGCPPSTARRPSSPGSA